MNEYDSNMMHSLLTDKMGFEETSNSNKADLLIVNTCSIREKAQEKVFSLLGQWNKLKSKNPELIIGVTGCVASQESESISSRAPYVDMVIGPQTIHKLPLIYDNLLNSKKRQIDVDFPVIEKFDNLPSKSGVKCTEYVTIMEGCSKYCSYCVVPYTRGTEASRPLNDIIKECEDLINRGAKEITLLGQNVNAYSYTSEKGNYCNFGLLLFYIANIKGLQRLRYTTSHPNNFDDQTYLAYEKLPKLVSHLHLPVQSGSDRVLSNMKRGYTVLEYKSIIRKLKKIRNDMTFSSDFIVGFPGETNEDFEKTLNLIDDINFEQSYSFIYSRRPGTPASYLNDEVDPRIKKDRLHILQNKINILHGDKLNKMLGEEKLVLVESTSKRNIDVLTGRTTNNIVVNFKGNKNLIGETIPVRINEVMKSTLRGEVIN
tara:strand:+ start:1311 stop:2597 length:1287 start_codon:yes stop_codon:yes gene_type:complete